MMKHTTLILALLVVIFVATVEGFQSIVTIRPHATTKPLLAAVPSSGTTTKLSKLSLSPRSSLRSTLARGILLTLSASNDDGDKTEEDGTRKGGGNADKIAKKVAGRKKRVVIGYRLSMVIYGLLGLSTLIPAFMKPELAAMSLNYAGGPILGAGFAGILASAAENDRLGSDTYKRLNLMYAKFGFLWLLAGILVQQTKPLTRGAKILSNPLVMLASFYALVNGLKGWGYGAKGYDKLAPTSYGGDLVQLFKNTAKVFVSPFANVKAGLYLGATTFAGFLKVMKLVDLVGLCQNIGTTSVTAAKFGSWAIGYAKIVLMATAAFTLFDAAKRDRLEGTTFIELNVLSSFSWLGMGGKVISRVFHAHSKSSICDAEKFVLNLCFSPLFLQPNSLSVPFGTSRDGVPLRFVRVRFASFWGGLVPDKE